MGSPRGGFGRLWVAVVASNLGDGLVVAAFPLLAASITRNPLAVSGLVIAAGLPWLLFGPLSGAVVDRHDRRWLMWMFDLGRATVAASFAVFLAFGGESLVMLYVVVFLIGTGETIVDTSAQALLPTLVDRSELDRANGWLFGTQTLAHRFIGPPLGGLLFAIAAILPVAADAVSFMIAAAVIASLPGSFKPTPDHSAPSLGIWASTAEGLRWLWTNGPIRAFAVGAAVLNIGIVAGEAILVLFAQDQLGLSGLGFGGLLAATAAGYTVGSLAAPRLVPRLRRQGIILGSVVAVSAGLAAIGLAGHWLVAAGGLLGVGAATALWNVIAVSYRQAAVPDRLLGRIMAAYRFIAYGAFPVGALLGGVSARIAGNRAPFMIGAILVLALIPYLLSALRGVELDPENVDA